MWESYHFNSTIEAAEVVKEHNQGKSGNQGAELLEETGN